MGLSHLWFLDYVVIKMSIFGEIIDIWKCIDIIQDSERMLRECWPIGMESQAEARPKLEGAQAEHSQSVRRSSAQLSPQHGTTVEC